MSNVRKYIVKKSNSKNGLSIQVSKLRISLVSYLGQYDL